MTCVDESGNESKYNIEEVYNKELKDTISYYNTWNKSSDDLYYRYVYKYTTSREDMDELISILKNSDKITLSDIKSVIGEKIIIDIEYSSSATISELNKRPHIKAQYYNENKHKLVAHKETSKEHNKMLIPAAVIAVIVELVIAFILQESTYFFCDVRNAFQDSVNESELEHLQSELERLNKKLCSSSFDDDEFINQKIYRK